jgi:hypothetical protein
MESVKLVPSFNSLFLSLFRYNQMQDAGKPLIWISSSKKDLMALPDEV